MTTTTTPTTPDHGLPAGKLLNTYEVAKLLGVSRSTVYVLRDSGELKAYRLRPRLTRFRGDEVAEYLAKHRAMPQGGPR